jgi:proline utilization trans-activator
MNRRHSGYCILGTAMRFSIVNGLHLDAPQLQLPSQEEREHRTRVWWTVYLLDRSWACVLGKPVSIQDDDVEVNLPAILHASPRGPSSDFADTDYFIASIRVANLSAQITASIYGRRAHRDPLSHRVQHALQDLGSWLQQLPDPLRSELDDVPPTAAMPIVTLYLYFNQVS